MLARFVINLQERIDMDIFFPFADYWWFYGVFTIFVFVMLFVDLKLLHRDKENVSVRGSFAWAGFCAFLALAFNALLYFYCLHRFQNDPSLMAIPGFDPAGKARQLAMEFLAGYVIEQALAVDNIFVFVVIFNFFGIKLTQQHRVLFYGIIGALAFRAIFIAVGAALLQYQWVLIGAGIFLIFTGIKILFAPEKEPDPGSSPVFKLVQKIIPSTAKMHGNHFFIKEHGKWLATPLFVALLFIEASDVIFAIDSVPAIFALTKEPLIVFTSNIFAVLCLRSLFFVLAGVVHKFKYLKYGLGFILIFVGLKMTWLNKVFDGHFPISWSLGIIALILGTSVVASLFADANESE